MHRKCRLWNGVILSRHQCVINHRRTYDYWYINIHDSHTRPHGFLLSMTCYWMKHTLIKWKWQKCALSICKHPLPTPKITWCRPLNGILLGEMCWKCIHPEVAVSRSGCYYIKKWPPSNKNISIDTNNYLQDVCFKPMSSAHALKHSREDDTFKCKNDKLWWNQN